MIVSVTAIVIQLRTGVRENIYEYGVLESLRQQVKGQILYMIIHIIHVRRPVKLTPEPFPDSLVILSSIQLNDHNIGIHRQTGHCRIRSHTDSQFNITLEIEKVCADRSIGTAPDTGPVRAAETGRNHRYAVYRRQPFPILSIQIETQCPVIYTTHHIRNPMLVFQLLERCLKCVGLGKVKMAR